MKKNPNLYMSWLILSVFIVHPYPMNAVPQKESEVKRKKRWFGEAGSEIHNKLRTLLREIREARALDRKRKTGQASVAEVLELYDKWEKIDKKLALLAILLPIPASILAMLVTIPLEITIRSMSPYHPSKDKEQGIPEAMALPSISMPPLISLMGSGIYVAYIANRQRIREREKEEYKKQISSEYIKKYITPNVDHIIELKKQILRTDASDDQINIAKQKIKHLWNENNQISREFGVPFDSVYREKFINLAQDQYDKNINHEKLDENNQLSNALHHASQALQLQWINMILKKQKKELNASSPYYRIFQLALYKSIGGIKHFVEHGGIHTFDEPWVWPAIVELFYKNPKTTSVEVEQLQRQVDWPKWKEYWEQVEQNAHRFSFIDSKQTIQNMSDDQRRALAEKVKNRLVEDFYFGPTHTKQD